MDGTYSSRRLLIGAALMLGLLGADLLWYAPAPILTVINSDLQMSLAQGGLIISVICLLIGGAALLMNGVGARFLPARVFLLGLLLMTLGQGLMLYCRDFTMLLGLRLLIGLGIGVLVPVYPMLVMDNFPEHERPLVNTVYSALPYGASFLSLAITAPLFYALGQSWRLTMGLLALFVAVPALLWLLMNKQVRSSAPSVEKRGRAKGLLRQVARDRQVRLLMVADICDMWGYNFLSAFLPTYYATEAGMSLTEASRLTSLFPIAGIVAALLCGLLMSRIGLRKPFTWPMHLLIFIGTVLAVCGQGGWRVLGVLLAGFGNAGWAPALFTIPMEFPGFDALKTGVAYALIFSMGYIAAFISPLLGGWIGDLFSLKAALLLFSVFALIAALVTFLMKETGPAAKNSEK